MTDRDTIFALATPPGRSGVAVLRVSGPEAVQALRSLTRRAAPVPRVATLMRIFDDDEAIDDALILRFKAPHSFTGEDVIELHLHGGPAVIAAALQALSTLSGLRLAEPGEFTRRAFENGKLDLAEVEGIADLIGAETEAQRRQALRQAEGALSRLHDRWRTQALKALARLEAYIDFPDEDLPEQLRGTIDSDLRDLRSEIHAHLADNHRGERLRDGLTVAILGAPNAGKSSLLNRLAQREAAIVSATAGTTRDVIEVRLDLAGYPVTLADTAGLRQSVDEIEAEGVRRALARAEHADLKLLVFDAGHWPAVDAETAKLIDDAALLVLNKADLLARPQTVSIAGRTVIEASAKTGLGLETLMAAIGQRAAALMKSGEGVVVTRARHRSALEEAEAGLTRAIAAGLPELKAEDLRLSLRALGRITGRVDVEDVLDVIFREFCIGK